MNWLLILLKKIVAGILGLFMTISPVASTYEKAPLFGTTNTKIRQEVNITDAYMIAPSGTYATSSEIVAITDSNYTVPTYYFEVVASTTGATTATIDLVNATSSKKVATITMTGGQTSYARLRSTAFMPNSSSTVEYKVVLNNEAVGKGILASRIVVLQNSGSGDLNNTETQIEIGSATTTANNTTSLPLQNPKYWYYDSSKWDASPTFYVEATYKNNPIASSTTYNVSATTTPTFYNYVGSTGVGYVVAEGWGGGGGGDGVSSAATIGGGGGGGGTYARATTTVSAGSTNIIGVGRGGAEGTAKAVTASSTLTTALGLVMAAEGGEGATSGTGAATSSLSSSVGGVIYAGGKGGDGQTDTDTGGGGGGSAGPDGYGITGGNAASNGPGGTGGKGDINLGGAGGAGGNGGDDTCDAELGGAGVNNVLGAGGGGGADGDVSSTCGGGDGGRPGGGGGGSDEGTTGLGGPGQVKITEWIGTVGIALEESDGTGDGFQNFAYKQMVVVKGLTSTTTERVRSTSFTPTSGRNYRLVASTTSSTASYDIYNAKIVIYQAQASLVDSYSESNQNSSQTMQSGGGFTSLAQSFTGNGGTLDRAVFYLSRNVNATGNSTAQIYGKTGTCGTDATPTGAALATSDAIDVTTIGTSFGLITYTFTGVNKITLTNGTCYFVATEYDDSAFSVTFGIDSSSPTHSGNEAKFSGTWASDSAIDGIFYVYQDPTAAPTLLQPQYLLAPFKLPTGTSLQNFLTQFDTSEWSTTNAYITQAEAANGSNSVVGLYTTAEALVTNSTISTIDNRATSTPICLTTTGTYDTKATTNNNDIYAFRILVDVGSSQVAVCGAAPNTPHIILPQGIIRSGILQN